MTHEHSEARDSFNREIDMLSQLVDAGVILEEAADDAIKTMSRGDRQGRKYVPSILERRADRILPEVAGVIRIDD